MLFSDKFQQSKVVLSFSSSTTFGHSCSATQTSAWSDGPEKCGWFRSCSSSLAVDFPFVQQRLIPTVQTVQEIIELPQLQFVGRWSMSPSGTLTCRKQRKIRSCSSSRSLTFLS